jgi:hypothetical protein
MYPKPPMPGKKSMTAPPSKKGSGGPAEDLARKKAGKKVNPSATKPYNVQPPKYT